MIPNLVFLLKSSNEAHAKDKFEKSLIESNYNVKIIKTIDFAFKNLSEYKSKLENPQDYSGLIFSSPRCVSATKQAIDEEPLNEDWMSKWNYAVGETTFNEANERLGIECLGKESGNAKNLAQVIKNERLCYEKPFLYPHGNLKMDILKEYLEDVAILDEICVYETIPNLNVEREIKIATNNFVIIPEFMVFFSPSGLHAVINCLDKEYLGKIKVLAIGPTTEVALIENHIKCYNALKRPTPEDLLMAMKQKNV